MNDGCNPGDVAFVVVSCDKYADLWEPFFHSLRTYWPDCPFRVYLVTNHEVYADSRITTLNIGDDRSYADNLRAAVDQIQEEWVILWLEDVFISRRVDTARVHRILKEAQSVPVGYLKLAPDLPLSYSAEGDIGPIPKGVRYRSAIGLSLYHRKTLDKLLVPGASAWDLDTSEMSNELDEPFYALIPRGARKPPIEWVHGVIKGRWCWPAIRFLRLHGFADTIAGRERLGLRSIAYLKAFRVHNWVHRTLRKNWV